MVIWESYCSQCFCDQKFSMIQSQTVLTQCREKARNAEIKRPSPCDTVSSLRNENVHYGEQGWGSFKNQWAEGRLWWKSRNFHPEDRPRGKISVLQTWNRKAHSVQVHGWGLKDHLYLNMSSCLHSKCSQCHSRNDKRHCRHTWMCWQSWEPRAHWLRTGRDWGRRENIHKLQWKLDTDFWEKEALVWSQHGHIYESFSSHQSLPCFRRRNSSWSLPLLAISCKYFGFCLFFSLSTVWRAALCILILSQNLPLAFLLPPSSPAIYRSSCNAKNKLLGTYSHS